MRQISRHASDTWDHIKDDPRPALYLSITHMLLASLLVILCFGRKPPSPAVFWPVYCVLAAFVLLTCISVVRWHHSQLAQLIRQSRTRYSRSSSDTDPHPKGWTANRRNTIWTASITTLVIPLIFYFLWKPALVANVMVVQRAEVVSLYISYTY